MDGGSRRNPGPAAFGYVIRDGATPLERRGEFIGDATNNVAEYRGMIAAARRAVELGASEVEFRVDSELLQRQVIYGYEFEGRRYDAGDKLGFLIATVEYGLRNAELSDYFRDYLRRLDVGNVNGTVPPRGSKDPSK